MFIGEARCAVNKGWVSAVGQLLKVFLFVFVVMLFISKDSYLHDLPNHNDPSWFFMCGKAWVNGLTPYVDFADSKGPLLWLVYALGYMMTPHSYVGVFWLSCIAWTITLFLAWRSAAMFLKNGGAAFVAMLAVALAGLQPLVHNETRCEDFAMPFAAYVVYALCLSAKHTEWNWRVGMGMGLSITATAFMKYNITLMLLPFVLLAWAVAMRQCRVPLARLLRQFVGGCMVMALPFAAYFLAKGNIVDFVNEYLFVTLRTTGNTGVVVNTIHSILSPAGVYAMLLFAFSAISMARMLLCCNRAALLCHALFFGLCSINSRPYYFTIYAPFVVFVGIAVVRACGAFGGKHFASASAVVAAALLISSNLYVHDLRHADYGDFFTQNNAARREYYAVECMVAQVPQARIVDFFGANAGVCSDALPACRYWATQWGATTGMVRQQIEACTTGKADFAFVPSGCPDIIAEIKNAGWYAYDFTEGPYKFLLMSRRWLGKKHDCCRVTNMDVLLKRQPVFCKSHNIK